MQTTLKELKYRLRELLAELIWSGTGAEDNKSHKFLLVNQLRNTLKKINDLQVFNEEVEPLLKSSLFTSAEDEVYATSTEAVVISSALSNLYKHMRQASELLEKLIPDEDPNSINIKLPPVENFGDLAKISSDLNTAITQIIFDPSIENAQNKITSVENGSIWINLLVGASALRILASAVWSATVIYKKMLDNRMVEQQVRSYTIRTDSLEDLLNAQKEQTKALIALEAAHIQTEHFGSDSSDHEERIKHSIKLLSELILKGAEIHPALVAPESVENLFPNFKKLPSVQSKVAQITSGENPTLAS